MHVNANMFAHFNEKICICNLSVRSNPNWATFNLFRLPWRPHTCLGVIFIYFVLHITIMLHWTYRIIWGLYVRCVNALNYNFTSCYSSDNREMSLKYIRITQLAEFMDKLLECDAMQCDVHTKRLCTHFFRMFFCVSHRRLSL